MRMGGRTGKGGAGGGEEGEERRRGCKVGVLSRLVFNIFKLCVA